MVAVKTTDTQIQDEVLAELAYDERVRTHAIGVRAAGGVVMLAGIVASYAERLAAREAAQRVRGVQAVVDELEVHVDEGSARPDEELARAAAHALAENVLVPHEMIGVVVSAGIVTLTGTVASLRQRAVAESTIWHLVGVRGVENRIEVRPGTTPTDVKRHIQEALIRHATVDAEGITVAVHDGTVLLAGSVRTWAERQDAESAAAAAPGVASVENHLAIIPGL